MEIETFSYKFKDLSLKEKINIALYFVFCGILIGFGLCLILLEI